MKNSRGGGSVPITNKKSTTSKKAGASPGLASNGKPFRIRLVKCPMDHGLGASQKMAAIHRPSPAARGTTSLDPAARPAAASTPGGLT